MKYVFISDIHFGIRKNSPIFHANIVKFLRDVFFPFLDKHQIKHIVNLGDLFDDRKRSRTSIIDSARAEYYDQLTKRGIVEDLIIGNHDIEMRESNEINSPTAVFKDAIDNGTLRVHSQPTEVGPFLFIPWIHPSTYDATVAAINASTKRYCLGHLELVGFQLYRGRVQTKGHSPSLFSKFHLTCSGHYHFRSTQNNITYLGSPTQHTWQDAGDVRGFHTFDSDTGELTFIENPHNIFETFTYTNNKVTKEEIELATGKFVRILYNEINKESAFDTYCKALDERAVSLSKIRMSANSNSSDSSAESVEGVKVEDTLTMIEKYLNEEPELFDEMVDLYNRAQTVMLNG